MVLVGVHLALLARSGAVHSVTLNEPGHLVAGILGWRWGEFGLYAVNPPLVRMVATIPVFAAGFQEDWSALQKPSVSRPEFPLGRDFLRANGVRSLWLVTLARWMTIPFSALGALLCYRWAQDLFGGWSGIVAAAFWSFSPMVLGHGALIMADVPGASVGLAASYAFWRWLKERGWPEMIFAGTLLGLALLAKATMVLLIPLWPALWLLNRATNAGARNPFGRESVLRDLGMLSAGLALSLWVLNLGYLFEGTLTPLKEYRFRSRMLTGVSHGVPGIGRTRQAPSPMHLADEVSDNRFRQSSFGAWPVPLPRSFLLGLDAQQRDFEYFGRPSYLRGEFRNTGWWYYYFYAVFVKEPLGTLLLAALVVGLRFSRKLPDPGWRHEMALLGPAAVLFLAASSKFGFSHHLRYVLPAFPYVYIWLGQIGVSSVLPARRTLRELAPAGLACAFLLWTTAASLREFPQCLSYFNELAGGSREGSRHLLHSNVDWGQDFLFLADWLEQHPQARPIELAICSELHPNILGIDFRVPSAGPPMETTPGRFALTYSDFRKRCRESTTQPIGWLRPGWYAVSANLLRGYGTTIPFPDGRFESVDDGAFAYFQWFEPVATAGNSIFLYHITPDQARAIREDLGI